MGQTWKTIKIFVSSTFHDMHSERNYLSRVIYPQLKKRCAEKGLQLIWYDLRVGVEKGEALGVSLKAVKHCHPFFIALLGQRYGTMQTNYEAPSEPEFHWVSKFEPGHSITAMEIYHALLHDPLQAYRSFFYFRKKDFLQEVPEERRQVFLPQDDDEEKKLQKLQAEIHSHRPIFEYPCEYKEFKDGKVYLKGLEALGNRVLEDLWKAICEEYPEGAKEPDPVEYERQLHESFVEERLRPFVGRQSEMERLTKYVRGEDSRLAVITGPPGCGKSALLATWYRDYTKKHPEDSVLAYFIGASPNSTSYHRLLRQMCEELRRKFSLPQEIPADDTKLSDTLAEMLLSATRQKGRVILLVDALDQLAQEEGVEGLNWILDYLRMGSRLVTSCISEEGKAEGRYMEVLKRRGAEEIALPGLGRQECEQLIREFFEQTQQHLKKEEVKALLDHPASANPLYLKVALTEIKLLHYPRVTLAESLQRLPEDVTGLFEQVLERLEDDHGRGLVQEAFSLLLCSRYGLKEDEIVDLLSAGKEEAAVPFADWVRLHFSAGDYLISRGELIGFFHLQLAEAVRNRYPKLKDTHRRLASYFHDTPIERRLEEYPYQLQYAEDYQALASALSDLDFFQYAWDKNRKYEWMGYWLTLKGRFEPDQCYREAIDTRLSIEHETEGIIRLSLLIGEFFRDMGLYRQGVYFPDLALKISERLFDGEHPYLATSLNSLAQLHYLQGNFTAATPLYKRALEIRERILGPYHSDVAESLNNLAVLYRAQGNYAEAEPLYQRSLEIRRKRLGEDHPDVAQSLNNLAVLYRAQGNYAEAGPLYKRSLAIREKALGKEHPDVASSLNNLAGLYRAQGNYAEAGPLYKRSLAIREKALGKEHPDVATSLNNLAELYRAQGRYAEAEPLYERAVRIAEKKLGPQHPNTETFRRNLQACREAM